MQSNNDNQDENPLSDNPEIFDLKITPSIKSNDIDDGSDIRESNIPHKKIQGSGQKFDLVFLAELFLNLIVIIAIVLVLRTLIIAPFKVSGSSMCNTLNFINNVCEEETGEYIIINKFGYLSYRGYEVGSPQRSNIIVFLPQNEKNDFYIKRIIGVPGDTVRFSNGKVFLKKAGTDLEEELEEDYLNESNQGRTFITSKQSSFLVPPNNYFVMGDNRRHSNDSRHCFSQHGCRQGGTHFVERSRIQGKAWIVFWPFWSIRIIEN